MTATMADAHNPTGALQKHRVKDTDVGDVENNTGEEHGEEEEEDDDGDEEEEEEEESHSEKLEALQKTVAWQLMEEYQQKYYPQGFPSHIDANEIYAYLNSTPEKVSTPRKHYFWDKIQINAKKRAKDEQWRREGDATWKVSVRRTRLQCWVRPAAVMAMKILNSSFSGEDSLPAFLKEQIETLGLEWFLDEPSSWSPEEFWERAQFNSGNWILNHVTRFGATYKRPAININPFFRSDYLHPKAASPAPEDSSPPGPDQAPGPEQTPTETEATSEAQQAITPVEPPNPQADIPSANGGLLPTPSTTPKAAPVDILTGNLSTSSNTPAASPSPAQQHRVPGQGGRIPGSREHSKGPWKRKRGHGADNEDEDMPDFTLESKPTRTFLGKPHKALDAPPTPTLPTGDAIQKDVKDLRRAVKGMLKADFATRKEVNEGAKKTEDGFKASWNTIKTIEKRLEACEKAKATATAVVNPKMLAKPPSAQDNLALERKTAEKRLASATAQIASLTSDLDSANNQITTLTNDLQSAQSQTTTLTTNLCTVTTQLAALTAQLESAISAKADADKTITTLQSELAASKTAYATLRKDNKTLQSQHTALTSEYNTTQARLLDAKIQNHSVPELMDALARRGPTVDSRGEAPGGNGGGGGARIFAGEAWTRNGNYYRAASMALEGGGFPPFPQRQGQQQRGGFVAGEAREEMQRQQRRGREEDRQSRESEYGETRRGRREEVVEVEDEY